MRKYLLAKEFRKSAAAALRRDRHWAICSASSVTGYRIGQAGDLSSGRANRATVSTLLNGWRNGERPLLRNAWMPMHG
ncbi:MAG TPA: hypothetical protein VGB55_11405, partial [Tepidisphaeraceae bacterium]